MNTFSKGQKVRDCYGETLTVMFQSDNMIMTMKKVKFISQNFLRSISAENLDVLEWNIQSLTEQIFTIQNQNE